jgi:hypothetical protein
MRRIRLLAIPTFMLALLALAVAAEIPAEAGPPSQVQMRLEQYRTSSLADSNTHVAMVTRAKRPWNLTRDLRWPVLGHSVYFQTDQPFAPGQNSALSPLPFPPKEIWCALLESEDEATGTPSYSVVLVALHMDMYSADWMIHHPPSDPFGVSELLHAVGCEIDLE